RAGVRIADQDGDGGAEGAPFEDAAEDLRPVLLGAGGGYGALAGAAAVQLVLDFLHADLQPRRAAVDDDADAPSVAFAKGGNPENLSKYRAHARRLALAC